jgi:hypothetical protein
MSPETVRDVLRPWLRPVLELLVLPGAPYALYIGPMLGKPLTDMQMALSLTFVATLYAIREWGKVEAVKHVASGSAGGGSVYGPQYGAERPFEVGR